jgi:hypothetical protein
MRQGWRVVLLVLAYPALILLAYLTAGVGEAIAIGIALGGTAAYGAVVYRRWTLLLPAAVGAGWLGVLRVSDWITGACSVCGSDSDWSNAWLYSIFFFVGPLTLAMLAGLAVGWLARLSSASPSKRWSLHSSFDTPPSDA